MPIKQDNEDRTKSEHGVAGPPPGVNVPGAPAGPKAATPAGPPPGVNAPGAPGSGTPPPGVNIPGTPGSGTPPPGVVQPAKPPASAPVTAKRTYTVKKGDSLSKIAKELYGDASKWQQIYEANKDLIGGNPNLIQPGQELTIP